MTDDPWALCHLDDSFDASVLGVKGAQIQWFEDRDGLIAFLLEDFVDLLADVGELDEEQTEQARERFTLLVEQSFDNRTRWMPSTISPPACVASPGRGRSRSWPRSAMSSPPACAVISGASTTGMKMTRTPGCRKSCGRSWLSARRSIWRKGSSKPVPTMPALWQTDKETAP